MVGSTLLRLLGGTLRCRVHVPDPTRDVLLANRPCLLAFRQDRSTVASRVFALAAPRERPVWFAPNGNGSGLDPREGETDACAPVASLLGRLEQGTIVAAADAANGRSAHTTPDWFATARVTGAAVVPVSWRARPRWPTSNPDRRQIPFPFARVQAEFGEPLTIPGAGIGRGEAEAFQGRLRRDLDTLGGRAETRVRDSCATGRVFWIYNALLVLFTVVVSPFFAWKLFTVPKHRNGFFERLGLFRNDRSRTREKRPARPVWLHAVSMGEMLASVPLARCIREIHPEVPLVVTSMTNAGRGVAREAFPEAEAIAYFPYDYPLPIWRSLRRFRPRLVLHTESEIWPNFLQMLGRRGIPSAIINGRISPASARRFAWFRFFSRRMLANVQVFGMQSRDDCHRIIRAGADPRRVYLTGSLKFDVSLPEDSEEIRRAVRADLGFPEGVPVFVVGSTHPGEDEILLDAFVRIRKAAPRVRMLLAPRHPERCGHVARLAESRGLSVERRTRHRDRNDGRVRAEVLLLDTIGELLGAYCIADVVFVGGSLVPIGGHNVLEPILYRKPVLFGPHTWKITDTVRRILVARGAAQVSDAGQIAGEVLRLLADPGLRDEMGKAAYNVLETHRGATRRTLALLEPLLSGAPPPS